MVFVLHLILLLINFLLKLVICAIFPRQFNDGVRLSNQFTSICGHFDSKMLSIGLGRVINLKSLSPTTAFPL